MNTTNPLLNTYSRTDILMLRAIGRLAVLVLCGASAVACHNPPAPDIASTKPARPDQSTVFFPATIDTYSLDVSQVDREHLAEEYALRQIDPCGFIDQETLTDSNHKDFAYTYSSVKEISPSSASYGPIYPLGREACLLSFPSPQLGYTLSVSPGDPGRNGTQFTPDPSHPGVERSTSSDCAFRVPLPIAELPGAPTSMRDPVLSVIPMNSAHTAPNVPDAAACSLSEAIAGDIAAQIRDQGIPVYTGDSIAGRFLTSDPCAAAVDLHAVGLIWKDPNPQAQWNTTWRHPGVCNLMLTQADNGSEASSAVVKYGLATWNDAIVTSPDGRSPARSEQGGVTLFDLTTDDETSCGTFVVAKANAIIEPTRVGTAAPTPTPPTPVVTVRLNTPPGGGCADIAKQAALTAVKRAA